MAPIFLIVDPFHEYALRFIDVARERLGASPLCVFTEARPRAELRDFPLLRDLERIHVPVAGLREFARKLRNEREVLGVIPFNEQVLKPSVELLLGLDSSWNEPRVLAVLRDKCALKQALQRMRPVVRVGISRLVTAADAQQILQEAPERFVLKPNSGFGNRGVGYFSFRTPAHAIDEFLRASGNTELVLEEYISGPEFFVNAQVDHQGGCVALAAFQYDRVWANGRQLDWLTRKVAHSAPEFRLLEHYAQAVVAGLRLRRSPIHLEVKLVDGVPWLVELGARLAGNGNALVCNRLHGGRLDLFALAADHYLREAASAQPGPDWGAYDATDVLYVHGVSFERGLIYQLEGIDTVERHPFFTGWVKKPTVGQRLSPTVDLFSSPFCFLLQSREGPGALEHASEELRRVLRINQPGAPFRKVSVSVADLFGRLRRRLERLTTWGRVA